jgi:hypothetical protein
MRCRRVVTVCKTAAFMYVDLGGEKGGAGTTGSVVHSAADGAKRREEDAALTTAA